MLVTIMSAGWIILVSVVAWIVIIAIFRLRVLPWLETGPGGNALTGIMWRIIRLYCRLVHRVTFHGMEEFRNQLDPGPLIVVSNHTGAIDPLLIQSGCRFKIRWLMASEMMTPYLDWLWKHQQLIAVDRDGRDVPAAREAIRHVRNGGTVGVFPEGRIVVPPREIRPFVPGVGLIVAKTRVPVVLVWVSDTPDTPKLSKSILTPSRAHVHFVEFLEFDKHAHAREITNTIRQRFAEATSWPLNDEHIPKPVPNGF